MIRFFDVVFSVLGILFLSPLLVIVYIMIVMESKGGGFYKQERVGLNGTDFKLIKFNRRISINKILLIDNYLYLSIMSFNFYIKILD